MIWPLQRFGDHMLWFGYPSGTPPKPEYLMAWLRCLLVTKGNRRPEQFAHSMNPDSEIDLDEHDLVWISRTAQPRSIYLVRESTQSGTVTLNMLKTGAPVNGSLVSLPQVAPLSPAAVIIEQPLHFD